MIPVNNSGAVMRDHPNNSAVMFRANDVLVAAAEARARHLGKTLSALMRDVLTRELEGAS